MKNQKIAIFHDYFDEIGGGEITVLHMARALNATIFTTNIDYEKIKELGFSDINLISIGKIPKSNNNAGHLRKFLTKQFLAKLRFSRLKIKNFDRHIFTGSYSIFAAKNHRPNLYFCLSVPRGLYEKDNSKKNLSKKIIDLPPIKLIRKHFDKKAITEIQKIISNSKNTQENIKKYYNRNSKVINSPIPINEFSFKPPKNYWLSVGRIIPHKNQEVIIKAFQKIPNENLIITGPPEDKTYFNHLQKISTKNIKLTPPIFNSKKLTKLYSECKGFITMAINEDFGKTPIEAMASGKPVIASNQGGHKETIIPNETGILINNPSPEKIINAVYQINKKLEKNPDKYKKICQKQAQKFGKEKFIKQLKKELI